MRPSNIDTDNGTAITLKTAHYLVLASIILEDRDMRTLHAVLDTVAGPNLVRNDMLPLGWLHALDTHIPLHKLDNANGRPLKLLGAIRLRLRLGNIHF